MISNPNLVVYACIARGPTILTEFLSPDENGIEDVAQRCIEKAPAHHSVYFHTIRNRTYGFLMDYPFVYFSIFHGDIGKSESLWFLNRVKSTFWEQVGSKSTTDGDKLTRLCFQDQFHPMFREILSLNAELVNPSPKESKVGLNPSTDSMVGGEKGTVSLLVKSPKTLMKKKKRPSGEANGDHNVKNGWDVDDKVNNSGGSADRDFSVSMMKNGGGGVYLGDGKQKAKQIWRKHVWVVLILDLVVCAVLFGVWLWVCRGFKCIDA